VLALLLEAAGSSVGIDRLIDGVWNSVPPASARGTVQSYLSNIRATFGDVIVREGSAYRINVTPDNFDVLRFEDLIESARRIIEVDPARGAGRIRLALSLWRGEPYTGLGDCPTLHSEAVRLEALRIGALEDCIDAGLRLGKHSTLVAELEHLITVHPFRERLISHLVLALYRSGRRVDALNVLNGVRASFLEEFGLSPSVDLRRLEESVLQQSPDLDSSARPRA
jgi:DNA-binding SARP family transcriptional activator